MPQPPRNGPASALRRRFRYLAIAGSLSVLVVLTLRLLLFEGPYRPVEPLSDNGIVDIHCHAAGIGAGGSGCRVSPALQGSYKFAIYLKAFGTSQEELAARGDDVLVDRIAERLRQSQRVGKAVLLAMDGSVGPEGELDPARTEVLVPNEFVLAGVRRHPDRLLFGASIHPRRKDALERLDRCARDGAVLVKWIPSIMDIDPADPALDPFYRRMKELGLPLLTHTGQERSFTGARDELCDPKRLRRPLAMGLTVIAAHIASTGSNEGQRDTDRLRALMAEFPNLHSEISSLTQANKIGYLREALEHPEFRGRLCYGSDYPLVNTALVSPWLYPLQLTRSEMARIAAIPNPWDADIALKEALGVPPDHFRRTATLLRKIPDP
jgi:uncharacterized protein